MGSLLQDGGSVARPPRQKWRPWWGFALAAVLAACGVVVLRSAWSGGSICRVLGAKTALVEPQESAGQYVLELGSSRLQVDPSRGARITQFAWDGHNLLNPVVPEKSGWLNGGSTFWTSPQSAWVWPPSAAIDTAPFTVTLAGTAVTMTSQAATLGDGQVVVEKRFSADRRRDAVDIEYTIKNTSTLPLALAGWEISRVPLSGLTFFPSGTRTVPSKVAPLPVTMKSGLTWVVASDAKSGSGGRKLNADGAGGWLAHVTDGGILFLKTFQDIAVGNDAHPLQAPGEGEIELFTDGNYLELENQGVYDSVPPGGSSHYKVTWSLRKIPASVPIAPGSPELIAYVNGVAATVRENPEARIAP